MPLRLSWDAHPQPPQCANSVGARSVDRVKVIVAPTVPQACFRCPACCVAHRFVLCQSAEYVTQAGTSLNGLREAYAPSPFSATGTRPPFASHCYTLFSLVSTPLETARFSIRLAPCATLPSTHPSIPNVFCFIDTLRKDN